jgi:hypothetical protein
MADDIMRVVRDGRRPPTEPQDAPGDDIDAYEGAEAVQPVNNGTASVNAAKQIQKLGYVLSEIPARFGGKVDLTDVKHYRKILVEG